MASEIRVPRLGWNMEQGVFLGWLKGDGASVKAGEPLFTLEGDKAAQDIEALEQGVLRIAPQGPKDGDTVQVGTLLGHVETGSPPSPVVATPPSQPAPRRRAMTPRARRAAVERGMDPTQVQGTGRNGRIRERDVLAHATRIQQKPAGLGQPLSPVRRTIAERLTHSWHTTVPVTLTTTVDATNLVNLRDQFKATAVTSDAVVPGYTDLFVKLTAIALLKHPLLNARWHEDRIVAAAEVHIGIAVDTEAGLFVPVVRNVPGLTLRQVARKVRQLAERARTRTLTPEDLEGGTFSVTNLGAYGIDAFTPIINWPQCAILGVGRIHRQPAVVNDAVVPCHVLTLSLTFDHRLLDGVPAARFLQTLGQGIENPGAWLVE